MLGFVFLPYATHAFSYELFSLAYWYLRFYSAVGGGAEGVEGEGEGGGGGQAKNAKGRERVGLCLFRGEGKGQGRRGVRTIVSREGKGKVGKRASKGAWGREGERREMRNETRREGKR